MRCRLLSIVVILAVAAACRREPAHARIDAAIAPLLPGDSVALAGLRVDRLRGTEFFRRFIEAKRITALREFEHRTALVAATDVWETVWCYRPGRSAVFIRGKFGGQFGLEPRFDAPGVRKRNYKGYYVLEKDGLGALFFNSGVAVLGKPADLERVVDGRDRPGEEPPQALIDAVTKLPACHFWAVARGGAGLSAAAGESMPMKAGPVFDLLEEASLHATITDRLVMMARGAYTDENAARSVRAGLAATFEMSRLGASLDRPQWRGMAGDIHLDVQGREVTLSADWPLDMIEALVGAKATSSGPGSHPPD